MCRTGLLLLLPPGVSHVVAEHDILLGQFEQHRVVEELVDTDVFTETLQTTTHCQVQTPGGALQRPTANHYVWPRDV